jgi:putative SOS response-associated peptidase YedK
MCGRYSVHLKRLEALRRLIGAMHVAQGRDEGDGGMIGSWQPRFNAAPGQDLPVVREGTLSALRWGLLANWQADPKAQKPINARVETIAELPTFREPFRSRRCVVPATGYFEWKPTPAKAPREPYWVHPTASNLEVDEPGVMLLAGVWDRWLSPEGEVLDSYAIVTMQASDPMRAIHDRMPLELRGDDVAQWLAGDPIAPNDLAAIVERSRDVEHLALHNVTPAMGSVAFDDPSCLAPEARSQLDLFS